MALLWAAGSGTAHAAPNPVPQVYPCYAPVPGTSPGSGIVPGLTSSGDGSPTLYYGTGTVGSADEAYAALPPRAAASPSSSMPSSLAFTGSQPLLYGVGGAALITLGGALVGLARRRTVPEGAAGEAS